MISSSASRLITVFVILVVLCLAYAPTTSAVPVMDIDYPANAQADEPITITINVTSDQPVIYVALWYINSTSGNRFDYVFPPDSYGNENNGTWSYTIPPMLYEGTLEFHVSAKTANGSTPEPSPAMYINLEGPEPAKPFPWSVVFVVLFLIIAFIATELVFKPGLYRPTGRQKAAALEEEDRKRELEKQNKMDNGRGS